LSADKCQSTDISFQIQISISDVCWRIFAGCLMPIKWFLNAEGIFAIKRTVQ